MTNIPSSSHRLGALGIFLASSFFLNLLWENLQAPLYAGFVSFLQHFWICFRATWGDLLFMSVIYAAIALIHRDFYWLVDRAAYAQAATWIIAILMGILLAANFELWAVYVDNRWQYSASMPLIPVLQIGLTPVLQMIFIPLLVLSIASRFSRIS
jgi:hypothetical protein